MKIKNTLIKIFLYAFIITAFFGMFYSSVFASDYTYTNQEQDKSGLLHYDSRYYDPDLGRFLQPDSYDVPNKYAYVSNDPVNRIDPSGHIESSFGGVGNYLIPDWQMDNAQNSSSYIKEANDLAFYNSNLFYLDGMYLNGNIPFSIEDLPHDVAGNYSKTLLGKVLSPMAGAQAQAGIDTLVELTGANSGEAGVLGMVAVAQAAALKTGMEVLYEKAGHILLEGKQVPWAVVGNAMSGNLNTAWQFNFSLLVEGIRAGRYSITQLLDSPPLLSVFKDSSHLFVEPQFRGTKGGAWLALELFKGADAVLTARGNSMLQITPETRVGEVLAGRVLPKMGFVKPTSWETSYHKYYLDP